MGFKALSLSARILETLEAEGYSAPTPIQAEAIPHILSGKDVLGVAQTGTGKTAAFAVPIIHRLMESAHKIPHAGEHPSEAHNVAPGARKIRALVLTPTRELAGQIEESFKTYGRGTTLRQTVVFGGVSAHWQIKALFHGVDVLVATPGRLLDLMGQGYVDLHYVQTLVLDEADQMLDMGFIDPIRKIVAKTPAKRQTLMFSATMPGEIRRLADSILTDPVTVAVTPVASTVGTIDQSVYFVEKGAKASLLVNFIQENGISRAMVFTRTKHGADKVAKYLGKAGIRATALHGNKTQGQRRKAMEAFMSQKPPVLVATDIAARGLDIDNVSHVVNYDLPNVPESYVHRIGRTGRAGASGCAISFCDPDERGYLRDIERLTKQQIRVTGGSSGGGSAGNGSNGARTQRPHGGPRGATPGEKIETKPTPPAVKKAHFPLSHSNAGGHAKPGHAAPAAHKPAAGARDGSHHPRQASRGHAESPSAGSHHAPRAAGGHAGHRAGPGHSTHSGHRDHSANHPAGGHAGHRAGPGHSTPTGHRAPWSKPPAGRHAGHRAGPANAAGHAGAGAGEARNHPAAHPSARPHRGPASAHSKSHQRRSGGFGAGGHPTPGGFAGGHPAQGQGKKTAHRKGQKRFTR